MLFHSVRGLTLLALIPVICLALAPVLLIGQEITAPTWIKTRIEAQAARVLNGGAITFGDITVEVGRDLHPVIRMTGTQMRDAGGAVLARVPVIEVAVSPRGILLRREVLPQRITLTGAQVALRRAADGSVAIAFEASAPAAGRAENLPALIETIDRSFEVSALAALESVRAEGLIVNYEDLRAARAWTVDGGTLDLVLTGAETRLTGDFALLSGRSFVTGLRLDVTSARDSRAASIDVTVTDALSTDIASQSPALSWLALLEAPLSAEFSASMDPEGNLAEVDATLDIAAGALRPEPSARPVPFESARAVLSYDPAAARLRFDEVAVVSDWGAVRAEGQAYLRELTGGLPAVLIGQFALSDIVLDPPGLYPEPVRLATAGADFRLRLRPFVLEVGGFQVVDGGPAQTASVVAPEGDGSAAWPADGPPDGAADRAADGPPDRAADGLADGLAGGPDDGAAEGPADGLAEGSPTRMDGTARVSAGREGWTVALDARVDRIGIDRLMALWPEGFRPGTRRWFADNVATATLTDLTGAFRLAPGQEAPVLAMTQRFEAAEVRVLGHLPPVQEAAGVVTMQDDALTVMLERGRMIAPQGGAVALAGSVFRIPDMRIRQPPATVHLQTDSTVTAALSILDSPPWSFIARAGREVTLAQGRARAEGDIALRLRPREEGDRVLFAVEAGLTDVRSDVLVPGRTLAAAALSLTADQDGMRIAGPMRLGRVPGDVTFSTGFGPGSDTATVAGEVELSERFIDEFGIGLPAGMVTGAGTGQLQMTLGDGPPRFALTSDMAGLRLSLPPLGYVKGPGTTGRFEIEGVLGDVPRVDRVAVAAAGLDAEGRVTLRPSGGLDRAEFSRLRLGGWLNSPATLVGRGPGRPPEVRVAGGTLDLRRAAFGGGGAEGGPMVVELSSLQVTEGIALTGFRGEFSGAGGFNGQFSAQVNGGAAIRGSVAPGGGGTAVRVVSDDAGAVISSAGLVENGVGGSLDLTLIPAGAAGVYDGTARIREIRVRDAPSLAQLLDAISVVGLLQQLDGQGLSFTDVQAAFRILPDRIAVSQASAVGPGLGISLDGTYTQAGRVMDFRGVISPLYLLNGVGAVLTRPGEGLFGFNYTLRGPVGSPQVQVNPLSILTPGMFREIFRAVPPE